MSGGSANAVHVAPGASVYIVTRASGDGSDSDRPNIVSASCSDTSSDSSKEASDCPSAPENLPREKVRHSCERGRCAQRLERQYCTRRDRCAGVVACPMALKMQ
jgi:hypothetical protein